MRICGTDLDTPSFDSRAALCILVCDDRGSKLTQQQDLEFGNEIHVSRIYCLVQARDLHTGQ